MTTAVAQTGEIVTAIVTDEGEVVVAIAGEVAAGKNVVEAETEKIVTDAGVAARSAGIVVVTVIVPGRRVCPEVLSEFRRRKTSHQKREMPVLLYACSLLPKSDRVT